MYFLEFPQNIIGYVAFKLYTRKNKRSFYKYRDAYVTHVSGRWGAISLSRFIFADDRYYESELIKHEYGHTMHFLMAGPESYTVNAFLPSVMPRPARMVGAAQMAATNLPFS